ncbi:hypothetical protein EJ913_01755 [Azospirillum doebereinerae]|uniref:Uncharacterized protein n=1 Tax=Azospirillum doebereinerae TaxID=92933 RepID=A0A3S0VLF3_9PROT|nr:hypothetical protein EJ913_01755 [Azospirillum doebereinerae]
MREKGWDEGCSPKAKKRFAYPSPQPLSRKGRGAKSAPTGDSSPARPRSAQGRAKAVAGTGGANPPVIRRSWSSTGRRRPRSACRPCSCRRRG